MRTRSLAGLAAAPAQQLPNIIIRLNDDQGWGDIDAAGHPVLQTPAADRLALEGVRITDMTANFPVCSPSRAGLLTGRDPHRFGPQHILNEGDKTNIPPFHQIPLEEPALARVLKQAGYRTAHIGKWHVSLAHRRELGCATPAGYGFDHELILGASHYDPSWTRNGERIQTLGRWSADLCVDEAIDFIEASDGGEPFFINLWSFAPHGEVKCSDEHKARYADRTPEEQICFGTITQQDEQYVRLLDYLDDNGLAESTVIFYSSDNGSDGHTIPWLVDSPGFTGPFSGSKHNIHEAGIRVPGIVRWPGVAPAGTVGTVPVSLLDVVPMFSALVGVPTPEGLPLDGGDFRPAPTGQPVERAHALYWQYGQSCSLIHMGEEFTSPQLAMRKGPWKLMGNFGWTFLELYNLDIDPGQRWNLAERHPEIAADMLEEMKLIHADINGPYQKVAKILHPNVVSPAYKGNYVEVEK